MVGNIKDTKRVYIVNLETSKETLIQTLPVPQILHFDGDDDAYRIGCSVITQKTRVKELVTISKPHDPYRINESYFYILNLETLVWTQLVSYFKYFGKSFKILKI